MTPNSCKSCLIRKPGTVTLVVLYFRKCTCAYDGFCVCVCERERERDSQQVLCMDLPVGMLSKYNSSETSGHYPEFGPLIYTVCSHRKSRLVESKNRSKIRIYKREEKNCRQPRNSESCVYIFEAKWLASR